ncbi:MAG: hypothetical protein K2G13_04005 [Muribaculaceae bacterium]|nr:hypothetical protein [Muribaculaceae bacterium]
MSSPYSGWHSPGFRFRFHVRSISHRALFLPLQMKELPEIISIRNGESPLSVFNVASIHDARDAFLRLRYAHDFSFWAAREYFVRDIHDPDRMVPLILNYFQCHIIDTFLRRFFRKMDSRYVITKQFRSYGVTTCVQAYILWLQLFHWNKNSNTCGASDICIRPLKANLMRYIHKDGELAERRIPIPGADCRAFFNTFRSPDALRGIDFAYVHLADMSKWNDPARTYSMKAYVAGISGVLPHHNTLIVMEGNIPRPDVFRIEKNYNLNRPNVLPIQEYPNICRNPFFLRQVVNTHNPNYATPFILIDLNTNPFPDLSIV